MNRHLTRWIAWPSFVSAGVGMPVTPFRFIDAVDRELVRESQGRLGLPVNAQNLVGHDDLELLDLMVGSSMWRGGVQQANNAPDRR
jgi:hypothetical protein